MLLSYNCSSLQQVIKSFIVSHADNNWLSFCFFLHLQEGGMEELERFAPPPSHHHWDHNRLFTTHRKLKKLCLSSSDRKSKHWGDAMCTRRRYEAHSADFFLYSQEWNKFSYMLKVLLIDGAENCSLWYIHGASLSDRRRWKEAALSEWQEHYQSIFHRCQRGLVPVSSSGCHLLNEGMKGMFKVETQTCLDKGLHIVTGRKIAFQSWIKKKSRLLGILLIY